MPEQDQNSKILTHHRFPRWAWWFVIALAFAAIFGAGTQVLFRQWRANMKIEIPAHKEKGQQLEGWQTYRNEKFGFEVKYPKNWSFYTELGPVYFYPLTEEFPGNGLTVNIENNSEFLNTFQNIEKKETTLIDNVKGDVWYYNADSHYNKGIYVAKNYKYYYLVAPTDRNYVYLDSNINQILSTFKFISTSTENILPPDPGEAGKATLEGIDSDRDGVRDDVQRFIVFNIASPSERGVYAQLAHAMQSLIVSADSPVEVRKFVRTQLIAIRCLYYTVGESYETIYSKFRYVVLNTKARGTAYFTATDYFAGQTTVGIPDDASACDLLQ